MTKQLALKEEATREKLRGLKEMLRKSREEALLGAEEGPAFQGFIPAPAFNGGAGIAPMFSSHPGMMAAPQQPSDAGSKGDAESTDREGRSLGQTFVVESSGAGSAVARLSVEDLETSVTRGDDGGKSPRESIAGKTGVAGLNGGFVPHGLQQQSSSSSSNPPSRSGSKADMKWESAYSRPSTAHSTRSQEWTEPQQRRHVHSNGNSSAWPGGASEEGGRNSGRVSASSNSSGQSSDVKKVSPDPTPGLPQENVDGREEGSADLDGGDHLSRGDLRPGVDSENYSPTVMPSEYVHGMDRGDKFDARKMGLSSKTFDSALSSMLNDDSKTVSYGFEFYDRYARVSKPPVKRGVPSRSSDRRTPAVSHRSPERRTTAATELPSDHTEKFARTWGPEAKVSSFFGVLVCLVFNCGGKLGE